VRNLNTGCACFPWFLSFGNRTQNSRVAGARPNHQPIGGSDPNQQGIWSPPRAGLVHLGPLRNPVLQHRVDDESTLPHLHLTVFLASSQKRKKYILTISKKSRTSLIVISYISVLISSMVHTTSPPHVSSPRATYRGCAGDIRTPYIRLPHSTPSSSSSSDSGVTSLMWMLQRKRWCNDGLNTQATLSFLSHTQSVNDG
jgi:hypothetical protein